MRAIHQSPSIYSFNKGSEAVDLVNATNSGDTIAVSWAESRLGKGFCNLQTDGNGGRLYAIGPSVSKLGKNIGLRHIAQHEHLVCIDIVNCHPRALCSVYPNTIIESYVNDRENHLKQVMDHYSVDRNAAKHLFLRLVYGGCLENWRKTHAPDMSVDLQLTIDFKHAVTTL